MTKSSTAQPASYVVLDQRPDDVVLSPDGSRAYCSLSDGHVAVIDLVSRKEIGLLDVGRQLGGIDISPDGKELVVVEKQALKFVQGDYWWDDRTKIASYGIDLKTDAVTQYNFWATGADGPFVDVAVTDNGHALFSQTFGGSGWVSVHDLNLKSGEYSTSAETYSQDGVFSTSYDHSHVLYCPENISDAPLYMYKTGSGFYASHDGYEDDVQGFNFGVQAMSLEANLVVQYLGEINVYNTSLNFKFSLDSSLWNGDYLAGMTFDANGKHLYLLDVDAQTVVELSTNSWQVTRTFDVGTYVGDDWTGGDYGDRLLMSHDGRFLTVVTSSTLQLIDLAVGGDLYRGTGGADELGGGPGDDRYVVNNAGDRVFEFAGEGKDQILAFVSYVMPKQVEVMKLMGSTAIDGTGNAIGDHITGNGAENHLSGLAGDDVLKGGGGDDTLAGGMDRDVMAGGEGADVFAFSDADFGPKSSTVDRIADFSHAQGDLIDLSAVDAIVNGHDDAFTYIGSEAFHGIAGELRSYAQGHNTFVAGDTDGDGAADFSIRLDGALSLTSADFVL